ncbi:nicotinamide-nucleotide amidohydrolase family protein [Saccharicrinis fermentans]|uniref:CinA-like protein n=2 Tax=Saccharicrinis fermentans TaxID=982 RepID=W7Y3R9_9BACT|nr:nicotinamide-nucleotide amidohydrolase family protein [Saccharicrinis fermentans]GAF02672.1 hypothetical protein JCM21142_31312 [Saccharicrinis fermentans DSM 9555 = JCM 21142]
MWFEDAGTIFVSMPGVPSEMKHAMKTEILPRLVARCDTGVIVHRTVLIHNIPEAVLAEMLVDFERSIPDFVKLAYLPAPGRIRLRFTGRGSDKEKIEGAILLLIEQLKGIVGDAILGYDDVATVQLLASLFNKHKLTLSSAESCTGGNIAHQITMYPGSSSYFRGSVVAYHNDVKMGMLAVKEKSLKDFGAVSKEVVEQMAMGARYNLGTDYAVATSGIAGPDGGTPEKPVGTIWIAVAGPQRVVSQCYSFGYIRERNIMRTTEMALVMLKKMVEEDLS